MTPLLPQPWEEDEQRDREMVTEEDVDRLGMVESSGTVTGLVASRAEPLPPSALADLRTTAMNVPVDVMQRGLKEYDERRTAFRDWLLSKMETGVHFGVPPGCEPPKNVDPKQWKSKPSLYKAGAELVVDLMGVEPKYSADEMVITQLGEKAAGVICIKCELFDQAGKLKGEGRGCYVVGENKRMSLNGGIKQADKRAMVDAVLNTYRLSDLFTQDIEDNTVPPLRNPTQQEGAPKAAPRGETNEQKKPHFNKLVLTWRKAKGFDDCFPDTKELAKLKPSERETIKQRQAEARQYFLRWSVSTLGRGDAWEPGNLDNWSMQDIAAAIAAVNEELGG